MKWWEKKSEAVGDGEVENGKIGSMQHNSTNPNKPIKNPHQPHFYLDFFHHC